MTTTKFSRYVLWVHLLLVILLISQLAYSSRAVAADDVPHLFDYASWFKPSQDAKDKVFVSMDAKRDNGTPWVFYYYIAAIEGDEGETSFEVMPEGIPVELTDAYINFNSKSMGQGEPKDFKTLQGLLNEQVPDRHLLIEPPDLTPYDPSQLRYQTLLMPYHNEKLLLEPASFGASLVRSEHVKPVALYMISGQGPVPEQIQQFIDQTHGSWFQRYRHIIFALVVSLAALYGYYRYASR